MNSTLARSASEGGWVAPGDDVLNGDEGDDILDGGDGEDVAVGGDGDDTILNVEFEMGEVP